MISYTWRPPHPPPILSRLNFAIWRLYLFDIQKITFIPCFLTSDQFLERKAKNYRFLAFRRNFQIHGMGSRSSKMLKISYGRLWKLVNMTNDGKLHIWFQVVEFLKFPWDFWVIFLTMRDLVYFSLIQGLQNKKHGFGSSLLRIN